jgi:predicted regulator of Ras-like GTPase activity (Roadblock/LC7/MglB family)
LRATFEDTERFGTRIEPLETSALPPVPVEPATAETIARAEPEAVARVTAATTKSPQRPVISLHSPDLARPADKNSQIPGASSDPSLKPAPNKIPFDFPPKGTGRPASERVPASSGPPVPTFPSSRTEPARIPFQMPPGVADSAKSTTTPAKATITPSLEASPTATGETDRATIVLALKPILQNLPAFQLNGDVAEVDGDVRVEFPRAMIESQLATGRVVVPAKTFYAALAETHRQLFIVDPEETPVPLPLQEVLKNLPSDALKIRVDQECALPNKDIETPFSITAKQDSQRFQSGTSPVAKVAAKLEKSKPEAKVDVAPHVGIKSKEEIDAKEAVERIKALRGITACAITFSDGLSLAGNLPAEMAAEGLCAMAPALLRRIEKHMLETKLGPLVSMTLHSAKVAISFFIRGNIYLAALHSGESLADETRAQLTEIMEKLSRTYAQPEATHVDH